MPSWSDSIAAIASARAFLFVPGSKPDRFEKALNSGADVVILDLEDAVAPSAKSSARQFVKQSLRADRKALVRINAPETEWFEDDLSIVGHSGLLGVMLPKAERGDQLSRVANAVPTVALIESARGLASVDAVAGTKGVVRLAFGTIDLALDLGIRSEDTLVGLGAQLVVASRARGLAAPIDGVTLEFKDFAPVEQAVRAGRARGFGAKLCIHPAQIPAVRRAFSPTTEELEQAKRIVAADRASNGAAVALDGRMIDKPVVAQAYKVLTDADLG